MDIHFVMCYITIHENSTIHDYNINNHNKNISGILMFCCICEMDMICNGFKRQGIQIVKPTIMRWLLFLRFLKGREVKGRESMLYFHMWKYNPKRSMEDFNLFIFVSVSLGRVVYFVCDKNFFT